MYYLTSKLDPQNHANVRRQPFTTEEEAIDRARAFARTGGDQSAVRAADDPVERSWSAGGAAEDFKADRDVARGNDLGCVLLNRVMSAACSMSAFPPIATEQRTCRLVRVVPITDIRSSLIAPSGYLNCRRISRSPPTSPRAFRALGSGSLHLRG